MPGHLSTYAPYHTSDQRLWRGQFLTSSSRQRSRCSLYKSGTASLLDSRGKGEPAYSPGAWVGAVKRGWFGIMSKMRYVLRPQAWLSIVADDCVAARVSNARLQSDAQSRCVTRLFEALKYQIDLLSIFRWLELEKSRDARIEAGKTSIASPAHSWPARRCHERWNRLNTWSRQS